MNFLHWTLFLCTNELAIISSYASNSPSKIWSLSHVIATGEEGRRCGGSRELIVTQFTLWTQSKLNLYHLGFKVAFKLWCTGYIYSSNVYYIKTLPLQCNFVTLHCWARGNKENFLYIICISRYSWWNILVYKPVDPFLVKLNDPIHDQSMIVCFMFILSESLLGIQKCDYLLYRKRKT